MCWRMHRERIADASASAAAAAAAARHPGTPRPQVFKNGGAGGRVLDVASAMSAQQGVVDWMLKPRKGIGSMRGGGRASS